MPSWELFETQSMDYRERLLGSGIPRLAVEAGITMGWERWLGAGGAMIGLDRFGASAPGGVVTEKMGFTVERVVDRALELLGRE
jgi:transketolase